MLFHAYKKERYICVWKFSKKLASTNWLYSAMNPNLLFCWDRKTCEPGKTISVTLNTYNAHRRISAGASVPWPWVLPKHLTVPTACAEAARGLFVTRASSPKYCPREHRAISTAPFSSTSDLPWDKVTESVSFHSA